MTGHAHPRELPGGCAGQLPRRLEMPENAIRPVPVTGPRFIANASLHLSPLESMNVLLFRALSARHGSGG